MSKVTGFVEGFTSSGMMKWYAGALDCGHYYYSQTRNWQPIEGVEINRGDDVMCHTCAEHAEAVRQLELMDVSQIAYMRYKIQGSRRYYAAYRRDNDSPTGVMLITTFPAIPAIDAVIDRRKICTVSPTEKTR
jgi:hypothetical protein